MEALPVRVAVLNGVVFAGLLIDKQRACHLRFRNANDEQIALRRRAPSG
jgi:hypothetical protein